VVKAMFQLGHSFNSKKKVVLLVASLFNSRVNFRVMSTLCRNVKDVISNKLQF
jgi:hypothetical protein